MYYIFTCHELDIIKKDTTISQNDDIFKVMEKLKALNMSFKEYLDSLSEEKVLEANSFELVGNNHIMSKFANNVKENCIEFNYKLDTPKKTFNLLNTNHCLVIKKEHLNAGGKIPFTINYVDDDKKVIESRVLLHCYTARYNKERQSFIIDKKCWFNEYFNYFNFENSTNEKLSTFLRGSISFNGNTLASAYNTEISNFFEKKILELNDYIALTAFCRNANKDIFNLISKHKESHDEIEHMDFLANLLKYNICNMYNKECFEAKFSFNFTINVLLNDKNILKDCFKSIFKNDHLFSIKKLIEFFKEIFEEEKAIYDKEIKEATKKIKKKTSTKKKKKESSFEIGYELSKNYFENLVNSILGLYEELKYDDSDIEYFNYILKSIEPNKETLEDEQLNEKSQEPDVVEVKDNKPNSKKKNVQKEISAESQITLLDEKSNDEIKIENTDENQISFI